MKKKGGSRNKRGRQWGEISVIFVNKKRNTRNVKAVSWNIAGIGKVENVKDFLSKYDIIALQETWLEGSREGEVEAKLDKNFNWVFKAAVRINKKGRAKGGVVIGIRKNLEIGGVKEWEYGLVIKELKLGGGQ